MVGRMATHTQDLQQVDRVDERVLKWAAENPLPALTLTGAALYIVLRESYVIFYSRFGVDPEDVGLGYVQVLTQVATGSLLILAFIVSQAVAYFWLYKRDPQESSTGRTRFLILGQVLGMVLLIIALSFSTAFRLSSHVRSGSAIAPTGFDLSAFVNNILAVRVPQVQVYWADERATSAARWSGARSLMYLGQASGVSVFYDPARRETLRLPSGSVVVERRR
jgi:hypothetical protein